jgi:hypothetical protein
MDIFSTIGASSTLALVGLCYKMASDKNGKYVRKDVCDVSHRESDIKIEGAKMLADSKFLALKEDIVEMKADIKEILRNGKKKE